MPVQYFPAVVAIIGYGMSYASGSCMGTQGELTTIDSTGIPYLQKEKIPSFPQKFYWSNEEIFDTTIIKNVLIPPGILFPLIVPVVVQLSDSETVYIKTVAAALGSSVFGNLCSPIADTTIAGILFTGTYSMLKFVNVYNYSTFKFAINC